ncbi:MAG: CDP-alcohol phosphatidyltransferase family protein [Nanoarchaeota archaeon]|nr:CDP-alcohol phosphatidyltransferase family protein [Nanoarchaeota archaeon]
MKEKLRAKDLLAPANLLSLARIPIAIAMILLYKHQIIFLVLLTAAIVTDLLDGYVARMTRPTAFGAFLDPLCDKIFFAVLLIFLVLVSGLAVWQLLLLLLRDLFMALILLAFAFHPKRELLRQNIRARWPGKITTAAQFVALLWLFLGIGQFTLAVYAVATLSVVAIIDYSIMVNNWLKEI